MHQHSNKLGWNGTGMSSLTTTMNSTTAESVVVWTAPAPSDFSELEASELEASKLEASKAAMQQLSAELQSERCLNRLGQRLNACVLESFAAANERDICHAPRQLAQVLVDELSMGLVQSCAVVLQCASTASGCVERSTPAAEACFTVCAIASEQLKTALEEACFPSTLALMPFVLGQSLSDRELQNWQAQFPACGWQIHNGQTVLGWLLLAPALADFQLETLGELERFTASLNARLIEQSLDRYRSALQQVELIQTQAQQRQALVACNQELRQANRLKSEFLANTSHEVRTPLSSILGFTHLMREQGFSPSNLKHQEYLNIILSSGQHLLALINDILDLSKIEANQLDLHWETVTVKTVCQTAIALVREKANDKGLALRLEIAPQVETLVADSLRLKQMLFNLLSNALKFTRQGSVGLQVTVDDAIRFAVWDTGTGIAEDQQQLLFRPYSQIANAAAGRDEGTGLGLALTQKLAELHGGRVEIRSQLGQGSRFTIVLPLVPTTGSNHAAESDHTAHATSLLSPTPLPHSKHLSVSALSVQESNARVNQQPREHPTTPTRANHLLLVEDNAYNAKLMLTYLSQLGYELTWVKNATEMRRALGRALPALILMDIHLPGEDGMVLIHQLKLDDRYRAIPIIAQTAMAMSGDRDLCMEAGSTGYISKPIDLNALAQLISQCVQSLKHSGHSN